jgi:hypothetical protein
MLDLAPITRHLRARASSHLLVAAIHHLQVFEELSKGSLSIEELQERLHLKERPAMVLFPALCAMDLIHFSAEGKLQLSETGKYLTTASPINLIGYAGLEKEDPGVIKMAAWLRHDGAAVANQGLSYVKDEDAPSPMDDHDSARFFTMALAGRAQYLSPIVAAKISKQKGVLLDVAAGTGYYSYEWLLANPFSRAIVFDRPEVLKVAAELLDEFCSKKGEEAASLKERVTFLPGDMLHDQLPAADILLAASLFHDWPTATCEKLAVKFANVLKPGGELWIHDAFLNDELDGPLAVTDYSAMLFLGAKGRAYSRKEYRSWLSDAGLIPQSATIQTLMDYGLIYATKPN